MPLEMVCAGCGCTLYRGFDLRNPAEVLGRMGGRCRGCGVPLSPGRFTVDVARVGERMVDALVVPAG